MSLLVTGYNNPYGACGIGWLMSGNNPGFGPNAFSVVDQTCATGYYSFGHELGHNMGLNHARQDYTPRPRVPTRTRSATSIPPTRSAR